MTPLLRFLLPLLYPSCAHTSSVTYSADTFPDPQKDGGECGDEEGRLSSICDPDLILAAQERTEVQTALNVVAEQKGECGSPEMALAIMNEIDGGPSDEATEEFCNSTLTKWGVGKAECNNGILLVLAVVDRKMFMCTGDGAAKQVPDDEIETIIDGMKPYLKQKQYGAAIERAISQVIEVIQGGSIPKRSWAEFAFEQLAVVGVFLGAIGIVFGAKYLEARNQKKWDDCKKQLERLNKETAEALENKYDTFKGSCPICLEDFDKGITTERLKGGDSQAATLRQRRAEKKNDSARGNAEKENKKSRTLLGCGHGFHTSCIEDWTEDHSQCPICRQDISEFSSDAVNADGGEKELLVKSGQPSSSNFTSTTGSFHTSISRERVFRLNRIRRYYPDYVDNSMVSRAGGDLAFNPSTDASFVRSSPEYINAQRQANNRYNTSSSRFGGGRSGGGGRGGGW